MFELFYKPPADPAKETALARKVSSLGGRLDYREEPSKSGRGGICLTFEFDELAAAQRAAIALREQGEYIEGPVDYGA